MEGKLREVGVSDEVIQKLVKRNVIGRILCELDKNDLKGMGIDAVDAENIYSFVLGYKSSVTEERKSGMFQCVCVFFLCVCVRVCLIPTGLS